MRKEGFGIQRGVSRGVAVSVGQKIVFGGFLLSCLCQEDGELWSQVSNAMVYVGSC